VLADHGFDIAESVGTTQARLYILAFTKGKNQLTATEVEELGVLQMFEFMWNV